MYNEKCEDKNVSRNGDDNNDGYYNNINGNSDNIIVDKRWSRNASDSN